MRKSVMMTMLASIALLPVAAQAQEAGRGRGQEWHQNRAEIRGDRQEIRQDRREMRRDMRNDNPGQVRQDRAELRQDHRELNQDRREAWRDRAANRMGAGNSPVEQQRDWRQERRDQSNDWRRNDNRNWNGNGNGNRVWSQNDTNRRWDDNDRRRDNDLRRNDNRRWGDNDRRWNDNDHRWNDNRDWGRRAYNRDWRNDRRYDWNGWRNDHGDRFRMKRYYNPHGYRYYRWDMGRRLDPWFYSRSYWIMDPWFYRLPPAYGDYRWVRYFDDVMLIDLRSGEIVDIIYDFFW